MLYYPGGSNSLAVDDEWIYMQSGFGMFRAPKRAGNGPRSGTDLQDWQQIGRLINPEGSGRVVLNGTDNVYWASTEGLRRNARLYVYEKATGQVAEVDLGFTYLVMGADISDDHVVVFASDCLFAAVVDRDTLAVTLVERYAEISGSDDFAMTIHREHLYCENASVVYQAPLAGGEFTELATMTSGLQALVGWGDYLLFAGGGLESAAGVIDLTTAPATVTVAKTPFYGAAAYGLYSERERTVYWLTREVGKSELILLDLDTWARAHVAMPESVGPDNGIAQDEDYLYFGERDGTPGLLRTPKLTIAEVRERFEAPDGSCAHAPPYLPGTVCWEDAPVPGVVPGFVTPTNVASGKPLLSATTPASAPMPTALDASAGASDAAVE